MGSSGAAIGGSGVASGVVFPNGPTDGQLFYRTDLSILYYWSAAAALWLSVDPLVIGPSGLTSAILPGTSGSSIAGVWAVHGLPYVGTYQLWLDHIDVQIQYGGGTINGANFWGFTGNWDDNTSARHQVLAANYSTDPVGGITVHTHVIGASLTAAAVMFDWIATKTGAPPTVSYFLPTLVARLIG